MKRKIEVVPYRFLQNRITGKTASFFSCYLGPEWETVTRGYTWRVTDQRGTVTYGLCRTPVKTLDEALLIAKTLNN